MILEDTIIYSPYQFVGETNNTFSPIPVIDLKGMFHFEHINLKSKPNNGHGNELGMFIWDFRLR
jgi:hypothetical protein